MAVIFIRFGEYAAASFLFGVPLLLLRAGLTLAWMRSWLIFAALALALLAPLHLVAQTAEIAGAPGTLPDGDMLMAALNQMDFGKASVVRGVAALLALIVAVMKPGRKQVAVLALLGAIACASFSWMGHGAATEGAGGWLHLGADILHSLAGAAWVGALMLFTRWLLRRDSDAAQLLAVLEGFSAFGILLVGVIVVTGLVNSWFLVGLSHLPALWLSPYGRLLIIKIVLFLGMLILAAGNRARARSGDAASLPALRKSILVETVLGVAVLALVAGLGMLEPPSA